MLSSSRHSLLLQHLASSSPHSCPTGRQEEVAVYMRTRIWAQPRTLGFSRVHLGQRRKQKRIKVSKQGGFLGGLSLMWCHRCGGSPNVFPRFRELTVICSLRGLAGIMLPVWGSQACERRGNQAQLPLSLRVFCFKVG